MNVSKMKAKMDGKRGRKIYSPLKYFFLFDFFFYKKTEENFFALSEHPKSLKLNILSSNVHILFTKQ